VDDLLLAVADCHWRPRVADAPPTADELDAYIVESGVSALGDGAPPDAGGWREIPLERARHVRTHDLDRTQRYCLQVTGSGGSAPEPEPWFALFAADARCYFTADPRTAAWTPRTGRTFDIGVVIVDGAGIRVLWYGGEDGGANAVDVSRIQVEPRTLSISAGISGRERRR